VDFARRAPRHREILAGNVYQPPSHKPAPGDYAVSGQFLAGHAEICGPVLCEESGLLKGMPVQKDLQPFAGVELPRCVLLLNTFFTPAEPKAFLGPVQVANALFDCHEKTRFSPLMEHQSL
jgi:hypothetical protein